MTPQYFAFFAIVIWKYRNFHQMIWRVTLLKSDIFFEVRTILLYESVEQFIKREKFGFHNLTHLI